MKAFVDIKYDYLKKLWMNAHEIFERVGQYVP